MLQDYKLEKEVGRFDEQEIRACLIAEAAAPTFAE